MWVDGTATKTQGVAILDEQLNIVGQPWRGNLRQGINKTNTSAEWTALLFGLCEVEAPIKPVSMTLAIDTPLGFPDAFKTLLESTPLSSPIKSSVENPYL